MSIFATPDFRRMIQDTTREEFRSLREDLRTQKEELKIFKEELRDMIKNVFPDDGTIKEDDHMDYPAAENDEVDFAFLDTKGMTKLEKEELNAILNNEKAIKLGCDLVEVIKPSQVKPILTPTDFSSGSNAANDAQMKIKCLVLNSRKQLKRQ